MILVSETDMLDSEESSYGRGTCSLIGPATVDTMTVTRAASRTPSYAMLALGILSHFWRMVCNVILLFLWG